VLPFYVGHLIFGHTFLPHLYNKFDKSKLMMDGFIHSWIDRLMYQLLMHLAEAALRVLVLL